MKLKVRLSDVSGVTGKRAVGMMTSVTWQASQARGKERKGLDARVKRYELKYGMTSEEMFRRIKGGSMEETPEIAKWMIYLKARG